MEAGGEGGGGVGRRSTSTRERQRRSGSAIITRDMGGRVEEEVREGEVWEPRVRRLQGTKQADEEHKEAGPVQFTLPPPTKPIQQQQRLQAEASSPAPSLHVATSQLMEASSTQDLVFASSVLSPASTVFSPSLMGWSSASSPASATSREGGGSRRRDRRKARGMEAAMREAQKMAAEGDIDRWVDTAEGYTSPAEDVPPPLWQGPGTLTVGVVADPNPTHRRSMEDAHTIRIHFNASHHPPTSLTAPHPPLHSAWVGVYDGHGGGYASAYARKHLHRLFAKHWRGEGDDDVRAAFEAAFAELDAAMARSRRFATCGSTAVCAYIHRPSPSTSPSPSSHFAVHVASLGDAQAILLRPSHPPWSCPHCTRRPVRRSVRG